MLKSSLYEISKTIKEDDSLIPSIKTIFLFCKGEYILNKIRWNGSCPSPYKLIYANPNQVKHYQLESEETDWTIKDSITEDIAHLYELEKGGFKRRKDIGRIMGGEWDKRKRDWKKNGIYRSLKEVFVEGKDWRETEFVKKRLKIIEIKGDTYGYETKEEFLNERLSYIESIYHSMKKDGYLIQQEAPNDNRNKDIFHEVSVNIGRNGELIFNNRTGHHRLSLAKILNIEKIPMIVIVRHIKWQELRYEVFKADSLEDLSKKAERHLNHPDMQDVISEKLRENIKSNRN